MDPMITFKLICVVLMVVLSVLGFISQAQKKKQTEEDKGKKQE